MQITIRQLKQLIRETVENTIEEECGMGGAREGGPLHQEYHDDDEMGYNDHEMGYDLHDRHGHHGHDRKMEDAYLEEYLAEAKKEKEEDKKSKKPAKNLPAFIVKAQEIAAAKKKAAAAKKKAAARK